jgi:hypothetical protein
MLLESTEFGKLHSPGDARALPISPAEIRSQSSKPGPGADEAWRDNHARIIESEHAYDQERLNRLDSYDIREAAEFETEFKNTFGFAWVDEEVREPLTRALERLMHMLEDGTATIPGIVATVLKVLMMGHPRGFGRYYSGKDPWPRPSAIVQAEIDQEMPFALEWLRFELEEALEQEQAAAEEEQTAPASGAQGQCDL